MCLRIFPGVTLIFPGEFQVFAALWEGQKYRFYYNFVTYVGGDFGYKPGLVAGAAIAALAHPHGGRLRPAVESAGLQPCC